MRMGKTARSGNYRMDEQFQYLPTFEAKFWFSGFEKFWKFVNFDKFSIPKMSQI